MKASSVTVIDYGVGNLLSVQRSLEYCGADVTVTDNPELIRAAKRVVLPGVGAFRNAIDALQQRDLVEVLQDLAAREVPLLGICLGMQLLLDESEEFGITAGLGLIPGRVEPIPSEALSGDLQKVPHIGWSKLYTSKSTDTWSGTLLENTRVGDSAYFVHSFSATPSNSDHRVADCIYGGHRIPAVIARGRITGCQFHPEKSGAVGLRILAGFCAD